VDKKRCIDLVKFIIVRHGYSEFNKQGRFSGQADITLDELGKEQAEAIAKYVTENFKIDKIYSSDLCRACETARPTAEILGLPIVKEKELRELHVGEWQGMLVKDVEEKYPEEFRLFRTNVGFGRPVGGESYPELMVRSAKIFDKIAKENEGKTVFVATHGGIVRALRCAWLGITPEGIQEVPHVKNASITTVEYSDGKGVFTEIGYTGHLEGMEIKANGFF